MGSSSRVRSLGNTELEQCPSDVPHRRFDDAEPSYQRDVIGLCQRSCSIQTRSTIERRPTLRALTSLRFFAALLVFVNHINHHITAYSFGRAGVTFFFMLSGFILTYVHFDDFTLNTTRANASRFYIARFARIYPLHVVGVTFALFVFSCLELKKPLHLADTQYWMGEMTSTRLAQLLTQLALVQSWFPDQRMHYELNAPSWSISCEAFFYACFPLLSIVVARSSRLASERAILAVAAIAAVTPILLITTLRVEPGEFWLYIFPPTRLVDFGIGILLGAAFLRSRAVRRGRLLASSIEILAIGTTLCLILFSAAVPLPLRYAAIFLPGSAILIYVFAYQKGGISRFLAMPVFVRLGEASFSFYLIHYTVIVCIDGTLPRLTLYERATSAFLVTLALSFGLFLTVEQPMRIRIKSGLQKLVRGTRAIRIAS